MIKNLKISNEYFEDLIYPDMLGSLVINERLGGVLPVFTAVFEDENKEKMRTLNELTPITISYESGETTIESEWIIKLTKVNESNQGFKASIGGFLNKFPYYKNNSVPYVSGTSKQAIEAIAKKYFTYRDEAKDSNDKMNWLSFGKPDKNFLVDVWKHSYMKDDVTLIAIDSQGNFLRTSINTILKKGTNGIFSNSNDEKGITYTVLRPISSSVNTSLFGYTSQRAIIKEGKGIFMDKVTPEVTFTNSNTLNESKEINTRNLTPLFQSTNVHENYHSAKNRNFIKLTTLENNSIEVISTSEQTLNLLDLVSVSSAKEGNERQTFDGLYIIGSKTLTITQPFNGTITYIATREVSEEIK